MSIGQPSIFEYSWKRSESKRHRQAIKIARETTNNQKKKYNSVKHLQRQQFSFTKTTIMHLSMLSPRVGGRATHGKLTESAFPWVGILTLSVAPGTPRVGNLTWSPSWKTERNWKWVTYHLGNTQKSPEVNDLCFSSKYQDNMSERKVRKSVLFFGICEPSLLWLYDQMFINRRVFVPSVSLGLLFEHVCIFMNVLHDAWLHSKADYYACFLHSVLGPKLTM